MADARGSSQAELVQSPIYQKLDSSRSEIRLLKRLEGGSGVNWSLSIVSLNEKPRFTALSYVWGTSNETEEITLNGQGFPVKKSLGTALQYVHSHWKAALSPPKSRRRPSWMSKVFSSKKRPMFLWVDAVCINQNDIEERNSQVPLMKDIFSSAELVVSWLGAPDDVTHCAIATVEELYSELKRPDSEILDLKWILRHPTLRESNEPWKALDHLIRLDYWKRVWIFQEIVLARHVVLACGKKAMDWDVLATVSKKLAWLTAEIPKHNIEKPDSLSTLVWVILSTGMGLTWSLLNVIEDTRRQQADSDRTGALQKNWPLSMMGGKMLRATDPKDHIYGLLGITNLGILPDYSERTSLSAVYCGYVDHWLRDFRSGTACPFPELFFLPLAGLSKHPDLPSWVPSYPSPPAPEQRGPSFVLQPSSTPVFPEDTERAAVVGLTLQASGLELEAITQVERMEFSLASNQFSQATAEFLFNFLSSRSYPNGKPPLQAMFRLFMADSYGKDRPINEKALGMALLLVELTMWGCKGGKTRESLGIEVASTDRFIVSFLEAFDPTYDWDDLDRIKILISWCAMLVQGQIEMDRVGDLRWEVLDALTSCRDMTLFTTGSGYIGISPQQVQAGDRVCRLKGSRVLSALRRSTEGEHDLYVGTCFVVGLTNEEAATRLRSGRTHISRFDIR